MLELLEEHNLAVGALGVGGVLEGVKVLLEGVGTVRTLVQHLPNDPVSPAPYLLLDLETFRYVPLYLLVLRHSFTIYYIAL